MPMNENFMDRPETKVNRKWNGLMPNAAIPVLSLENGYGIKD